MLELVDRMVSKTIVRKGVRVRVPLSVIFKSLSFKKGFFVCFRAESNGSRTKTSQSKRKYLSFWQLRRIIGLLFKKAFVNSLAFWAACFSQGSLVFSYGQSIPFTRTDIFLQNRGYLQAK